MQNEILRNNIIIPTLVFHSIIVANLFHSSFLLVLRNKNQSFHPDAWEELYQSGNGLCVHEGTEIYLLIIFYLSGKNLLIKSHYEKPVDSYLLKYVNCSTYLHL